jgi:CheY-like chemotaxis protein
VLVAEDDEINARVITSLLSKLGHNVTHARDGVAALAKLKLESFDVAILDVRMPEADGPTVAMQWRAQEREIGGYLPMVALTANGSQEDMELCRNAGIDEFLVKPVNSDTLARVLSRLVIAGR